MAIIIEVLGTTHNVIERLKFDQDLISLGRSLSNDVILSDEHINEHHAQLRHDENGWRIVDNASLNGTRALKARKPVQQAAVRSGDIFILGRNKIRVLHEDHPVAPTVKLRRVETALLWIGKPVVLFTLAVLYLAVAYFSTKLSAVGEIDWGNVAAQNLYAIAGILALAFVVYLLSVLFKRGGNFLSHLSLLLLVTLATTLFAVGRQIWWFNTSTGPDGVSEWLRESTGYFVLFVYFWSILYLAFHLSLRLRTAIATVVVGLWILVETIETNPYDYQHETITTDHILLPPALLITAASSRDDYRESMSKIFGAADESREEKLAERRERDQR